MDYKKKYEEALGKARQLCAYPTSKTFISDLQDLFPELKESEDEKTKRILHSIASRMSFHLHDIFTEEEFQCFDAWSNTWLKKQVKKDMVSLDEVVRFLDEQLVNDKDEVTGEPFINFQNYGAFKETFISYFKRKMLEKQGEELSLKGTLGDVFDDLREGLDPSPTQDEQKSVAKVEPKFKVGDWVSNGRYTKLIVGINSEWPDYMFDDGTVGRKKDIDKIYHLWTIEDAKDGDVLVSRSPFIYGKQCPYGGLDWYNNNFIIASNFIFIDSPVHPASKEQSALLFKKMKEAGYEWDANNKQLIKLL